jgi:transcriptional regulator GlxA family with amidase domain
VSRVVFLLVPRLHVLDLAGPAQVFSTAADMGLPYELSYVAEQADVPTAQGLSLRAEVGWPDLTADDLVVVPGWRAPTLTGTGVLSEAAARFLRAHHEAGGTVASICAGADALGRAGLLDGRRCTTHHELQDELATRYPAAAVVKDVLFVVDGRVVTSAGIASGIDLALHLVAIRHGPAAAARIARSMVVYARRNGDDQQTSAMLRHRAHLSDAVHRVQDLIDSRFTETLPLATLARTANCSERTLTRAFREAIGLTPLRYQQALRLERAQHVIGQGATVERAARDVGFEDARMLRRLRARADTQRVGRVLATGAFHRRHSASTRTPATSTAPTSNVGSGGSPSRSPATTTPAPPAAASA